MVKFMEDECLMCEREGLIKLAGKLAELSEFGVVPRVKA